MHPDEVDEATLAELPVMTKDDLMGNFDGIVTDDRLRLDVVDAHLDAHLDGLRGDAYLFDRYHACASGGSTGRRGVFVYDWGGWATCYSSLLRHMVRALRTDPLLASRTPTRMAMVAAAAPLRSDKIYLTNLYNHALPLIRYEVTDQLTVLDDPQPCRCGSTHRRIADPYGRLDDVFDYAGLTVHPHVFRSPLSRRAGIVEYQVTQTPPRADVAVRCTGPTDPAGLETEIARGLAGVGLPEPVVRVRPVERLARQSSGKLRRFVPLEAFDRTAATTLSTVAT